MAKATGVTMLRRALTLAKLIPTGRQITTTELHAALVANGFNCSRRAVERQIQVLREVFGESMMVTRGTPRGYRWREAPLWSGR